MDTTLAKTQFVVPTKNQEAIIQSADSLEYFKRSVDELLAKRSYFISQVLPKLQEGMDYHVVKGRKVLAKGGAEKLASIYNLTAEFWQDTETTEMLSSVPGLVAYVCLLRSKTGEPAGQGRGASTLSKNQGDANKTIKMAAKSSFVDAVIRATGLSDLFTQDLDGSETRTPFRPTPYPPLPEIDNDDDLVDVGKIQELPFDEEPSRSVVRNMPLEPATAKQRDLISRLTDQKIKDEQTRRRYVGDLGSLDKMEASKIIADLLRL